MADRDDYCDDPTLLAKDRTKWAESRTDWAEDRTFLASMRTYAGWARTGMAAYAMGLGIHAIFGKYDPTWFPRGAASLFVFAGLVIIFMAQRSSKNVRERLNAHAITPVPQTHVLIFTTILLIAGLMLMLIVWTL